MADPRNGGPLPRWDKQICLVVFCRNIPEKQSVQITFRERTGLVPEPWTMLVFHETFNYSYTKQRECDQ